MGLTRSNAAWLAAYAIVLGTRHSKNAMTTSDHIPVHSNAPSVTVFMERLGL